MFITYIHKTQESRTRKTFDDFLVQARNFFLLPLSLKVLRHKERDTHSFYFVFFICPPSRAAPVARKFVWPLLAPKVDSSRSVSSSQLYRLYSKFSKSSARFRYVTSFALSSPVSYLGYCDISVTRDTSTPRARACEHLR